MKNTKIAAVCAAALTAVLALSGCSTHTSKSFTYNVETGDAIKIELNTTGGYDITSDVPFTVSHDGTDLAQGSFIKGEYYDTYVDAARTEDGAEVFDEGDRNGNEFVCWNYTDDDSDEHDCIVKVADSDTAVILGTQTSQDDISTVLDRLTITKE